MAIVVDVNFTILVLEYLLDLRLGLTRTLILSFRGVNAPWD